MKKTTNVKEKCKLYRFLGIRLQSMPRHSQLPVYDLQKSLTERANFREKEFDAEATQH